MRENNFITKSVNDYKIHKLLHNSVQIDYICQVFTYCSVITQCVVTSPSISVSRKWPMFMFSAASKGHIALSPSSLQFLNVPMFRNVTLKCLTEIAGVSVSQYEEQFVTLFTLTMMQLKQVTGQIPPTFLKKSSWQRYMFVKELVNWDRVELAERVFEW